MKKLSNINPKLGFWHRSAYCGPILALFYSGILYVAKLIGFPISTSQILIFFGLFSGCTLLFPIVASRLTLARRGNRAFDQFERRFDESGERLINDIFGFEAYAKLYNEELSQMPINAFEICRELLNRKECIANKELAFHLHIKFARFLVKEDRHKDAISELKAALSIHPDDLITNFLTGENYERMGIGEDAIKHYTTALEGPTEISGQIRGFVKSQIQRVHDKGPRKAGPQTGFRFMSH